jgi:peroxiredoxin Q/BCP
VAYFTASCDSADRNKAFAESLELDYPILSDPGKKVAEAYGVVDDQRPFPQRWTFYIGPDGKLLFIDKQVVATSHGEDMAKRLKALKIDSK